MNRKDKQNKKRGGRSATGAIVREIKRDQIPRPRGYVQSLLVRSRHYRFYYNNATGAPFSFNISAAKLGALESWFSTTTTLAQQWESVRIRNIQMYGSPPQNGQTVNLSIEYSGVNLGVGGSQYKKVGTSMGMTDPAYLSFRPPRGSQSGQWQPTQTNTGNVQLFTIAADGNGVSNQAFILDLWMDCSETTDTRANNTTTITGPAAAAQKYFLALDNNAGANLSTSNNWVPEGNPLSIT